jgi:small subunit ribosomal protein S20
MFLEGSLLANNKSAIKRARQADERHVRNQHIKSTARGAVRDVRTSAGRGDAGQASALLRKAASLLDRAVSKGVLHRNTVARRKSRLARMIAKAAAKK